jgi:hypothetical protein
MMIIVVSTSQVIDKSVTNYMFLMHSFEPIITSDPVELSVVRCCRETLLLFCIILDTKCVQNMPADWHISCSYLSCAAYDNYARVRSHMLLKRRSLSAIIIAVLTEM